MIFNDIETIVESYYLKRVDLIKKLIGPRIIDALLFMPSSTMSKKYMFPVSAQYINQTIITKITPIAVEQKRYNKGKHPIKIMGMSGDNIVEIIFFNRKAAYCINHIKIGTDIAICGKLTMSMGGQLQFIHPEIIWDTSKANELEGIYNIYPLATGVSQHFVSSVIKNAIAVAKNENIEEWIPSHILKENGWHSFLESIERIHYPVELFDPTLKNIYLQRICFDECLAEQIAKRVTSAQQNPDGHIIKNSKNLFHSLLESLPFQLTSEQNRVLAEIENDISSGRSMSRLLQGDVGSGKTIVALLTALMVIESGYQVAFLAPTEILARQHYELFKQFLSPINVSINILTANETTKRRNEIIQSVLDGSSNIIVGTHAIISDAIVFKDLGLVIIDEQHRFGVNQRLQLIKKSKSPHVLSMTATPIPRTLILSLYGDIRVSSIKNKPIGRKGIITKAIPLSRISALIQAIRTSILKGEKIYWICPLIEESEKLDYSCVTNRFEFLKTYFENDISVMHGRMKADERSVIFEQFRKGEFHVLVSTTIIEVGVDIPDATIIIIENAEKFGLSQLHQLRGRVGRSTLQSYCILLYEDKINSIQQERIRIIRNSNDGFYIAEQDFKMRGSGEILGTKQSGQKQYKTFKINDEHYQYEIYTIMQNATTTASEVNIKSCQPLLKMFVNENFENVKKSF